MKVQSLLTHKIEKLKATHGYFSSSMLTAFELSALKRGSNFGQKCHFVSTATGKNHVFYQEYLKLNKIDDKSLNKIDDKS